MFLLVNKLMFMVKNKNDNKHNHLIGNAFPVDIGHDSNHFVLTKI